MRFVVDLTSDIVDAVESLIRQKRYRSVQDFLFTSARNQLYVEEHDLGEVTLEQHGRDIPVSVPISEQLTQPWTGKVGYELLSPDIDKVQTIPPPEPNQVRTEIFGLWNRFFPIKITVRVLANMLNGNGSTVPLDALQENASSTAREFGKNLAKKERDLRRKRAEMVSTALPTKRDEFRAKARFKSHFVGYINKGRIEGAPATLRFLNMLKDQNGKVSVGLTDAGLKFASLANPVIIGSDFNSSFSEEERRFLIDHIAAELPEEMKLIRFTLQAIKRGATSPEAVHEALKKLRCDLDETDLRTLRSGILSRMSELKLLTRIRIGLTVRYQVTSIGEQLLRED